MNQYTIFDPDNENLKKAVLPALLARNRGSRRVLLDDELQLFIERLNIDQLQDFYKGFLPAGESKLVLKQLNNLLGKVQEVNQLLDQLKPQIKDFRKVRIGALSVASSTTRLRENAWMSLRGAADEFLFRLEPAVAELKRGVGSPGQSHSKRLERYVERCIVRRRRETESSLRKRDANVLSTQAGDRSEFARFLVSEMAKFARAQIEAQTSK